MLEVVSDFGVIIGDKTILDYKNSDAFLKEMERISKELRKIRDKGGLVVVESDGVQITAYNLNSYDRRLVN